MAVVELAKSWLPKKQFIKLIGSILDIRTLYQSGFNAAELGSAVVAF
jgi:hypothetical protein